MNHPTIITVAPTGGVRKEDTPYVPVSPEEIADCICECYEAGASVAHIHARDSLGGRSNDPEIYADIIGRIRSNGCPIICQISLPGSATADESLLKAMDCRPQMVSFMPGSINYESRINCFEPEFIERLLKKADELGILPEAEIADLHMINRARQYMKRGLLPGNARFNLALNAQGILEGNYKNLMYIVDSLPDNAVWSICGCGAKHTELLMLGLAMGGHARCGLEDTIFDIQGRLTTNQEQVRQARRISEELGRPAATVEEAKKIMKLQ